MPNLRTRENITQLSIARDELRSVPEQLRIKVAKAATKEGAKIYKRVVLRTITAKGIGNSVQRLANGQVRKRSTGRLRRNVILRTSRINNGRRNSLVGAYVAVRTKGSRSSQKNAFYARFLEDGWEPAGKRVGRSDSKATRSRGRSDSERSGRERYSSLSYAQVKGRAGIRRGSSRVSSARAATDGRKTQHSGGRVAGKEFMESAYKAGRVLAQRATNKSFESGFRLLKANFGYWK